MFKKRATMPEQPVTTSIDELVRYLKEHGETDSVTLAVALKVSPNIIEDWSNILEKANLVKISYRVGKMYISMTVAETKEKEQAMGRMMEERGGEVESSIATQEALAKRVAERIDEYKKQVSGAERVFREKSGGIKEALDRLDKLEGDAGRRYRSLTEKKEVVDRLSKDLERDMNALIDRADAAKRTELLGTGDAQKIFQDVQGKIKASEDAAASLLKSFDEAVAKQRKSLLTVIDSIRNEDEALRKTATEHERQAEKYEHTLEGYARETDSVKRRIGSEKTRLLDELTQAKQEIDKLNKAADAEMGRMSSGLKDVRDKFGGYAKLDKQIQEVKSKLEGLEKDKNDILKELSEMDTELRAIAALGPGKVAQKTERIAKVAEKAKKTRRRTDDVVEKSAKTKDDVDEIGTEK